MISPPSLLAFAPKYPKVPADVAVDIGTWLLVALVLVLVWVWSRGESWRRAVLGMEDPRVLAMLRIAFAVIALFMFGNMVPIADLLWSDEGMYTLAEAQTRWGARSLQGWSSTDGFFGHDGWPGFFHFLTHRPSLLLFHASPAYVRGYLAALFLSLLCFAVGFRTRVAGVASWISMIGIYSHNAVFFEGTDTVLRCVWWVLLFARCDAAWSVDAWIVRRTERARLEHPRAFDAGRLLDRIGHVVPAAALVWVFLDQVGQPTWPAMALLAAGTAWALLVGVARWRLDAGAPPGVVRADVSDALVPRFPRLLLMLQVGLIYLSTGLVKTGIVWHQGHALYYAMNNVHLARWELGSAVASGLMGGWLFRLATWITLLWEIGFVALLLGQMLRFEERHADAPWSIRERGSTARMWIGRIALGLAAVTGYVFAVKAYPYMLALSRGGRPNDPQDEIVALSLAWWIVLPLAVAIWQLLGRVKLAWPLPGGRRFVLDRRVITHGLLGRRLWLGLGVVFHGLLVLVLNIGMFPFLMLATYLAFFEADEIFAALRRLDALARRWLRRPARTTAAPAASATEPDPDAVPAAAALVHADQAGPRLPGWLVALVVLAVAYPIRVQVRTGNWNRSALEAMVLGLGVALLWSAVATAWTWFRRGAGHSVRVDTRDRPAGIGRGPVLIGSPLRRVLVVVFVLVHGGAVTALLLPTHAVFDLWRRPLQRAVMPYADAAMIRQGWRMFAPNPPRRTLYMRTIVVDAEGVPHKLGPSFYEDRPALFLINDRRRKMHRRMLSKSSTYLPPWAAAHCRLWVREHGEVPREVIIARVSTPILPPPGAEPRRVAGKPIEAVWTHRRAAPQLREEQRVPCGDDGGVSADLAARWGIAPPGGSEEAASNAEFERRRIEARDRQRRKKWDTGGS